MKKKILIVLAVIGIVAGTMATWIVTSMEDAGKFESVEINLRAE